MRAMRAFLLAATIVVAPPAFGLSQSEIGVRELPNEARDVLTKVRAGGPFAYERDGVVFGNREKLLPSKPRGYYHEYTVPTPGARNRGARRIVCGGAPKSPDACYYTADHYNSFSRIRE